MDIIYKKIFLNCHISRDQIEEIEKIITENPILKNPSELFKINKPISYLAFSINEIYEFISEMKKVNSVLGIPIQDIRVRLREHNQFKREKKKLRRFI